MLWLSISNERLRCLTLDPDLSRSDSRSRYIWFQNQQFQGKSQPFLPPKLTKCFQFSPPPPLPVWKQWIRNWKKSVAAPHKVKNVNHRSRTWISLRSKRFRAVSERRKTEERDSRFWPREKWNERQKMKELTRAIFRAAIASKQHGNACFTGWIETWKKLSPRAFSHYVSAWRNIVKKLKIGIQNNKFTPF